MYGATEQNNLLPANQSLLLRTSSIVFETVDGMDGSCGTQITAQTKGCYGGWPGARMAAGGRGQGRQFEKQQR